MPMNQSGSPSDSGAKSSPPLWKQTTTKDLATVLAFHERFLSGRPGGQPALLAHHECADADFSRRNLTEADFVRAKLAGCRFVNATMPRANLFAADLRRAVLDGADLTR